MLDQTRPSSAPTASAPAGHVDALFTAQGSEHLRWIVEGATIRSSLNSPYVIEVDLQTDRADADAMALFGAACQLAIVREATINTYGGIVSSVRTRRRGDFGARAYVTIEPALGALRHGRDTRIFQDKTVPEVLELVLGEALRPYERTLTLEMRREYPKREYTVQYQESDFDFAHRLMEEEGILYCFAQDEGVERMVLFDSTAQYSRLAPRPYLQFSDIEESLASHAEEHVRQFDHICRIGGTEVATRHFDWTHPSVRIEGKGGQSGVQVRESYEHDEAFTLHSFAAAYQASDVNDQIRVRREQQQRPQQTYVGRSTATELRAGLRFDLTGHPEGLDGSYAVVEVRHYLLAHVVQAGVELDQSSRYTNLFSAVTSETPWRPIRTRPRPRIRSIQTAIVTGPPGEEIHCDEHGRVKVQFHWDREGRMDDRTSCWIRCMQTAAGSGFGAWVLPRVGWEVVVAFVDGDPDRPIITGCLYNGDLPLPYPLPAKKALTLFKSNSYPGGNGFNELRLDDSKGDEEIFLHGEKDWNTVIENDHTRTVGRDETQRVGRDRQRTVGHDETITVGNNRTRQVGVDETLTVGSNRTRQVGANETIAIGANQMLEVGANRSTGVTSDESLEVGGDRSVTIVGKQSVQVGVDESYKIGKNAERKVGKNESYKVSKMRSRKVGLLEIVSVGIGQMVNAGMARMVNAGLVHMLGAGVLMKISAGSKLQLSCGGSKITLTPGGVKIEGPVVNVVSGGNVVVSGKKILLN